MKATYKNLVLEANAALKVEAKTFGYTVKTLLNFSGTPKEFLTMLKAINKDSEKFKTAAENVRRTKSGNYSAFYLLQYLYKQL
jgi:hypothetical protein